MGVPRDSFQNNIQENVIESWGQFISNMEDSLNILEDGINQAEEMQDVCTSEWCEATEHVIDDLSNWIFSISEPRWSSDEDSRRIKRLKRRLHDLYAKYKSLAS
jgi:hypothetical protein